VIPEQARLMAEHALRLVPIGVGQKHPPIERWQEQATSDIDIHESWWGPHPEWGVGWKMGLQDDGRWLFAIDVDPAKGGRESFRALIEEYGLADEFKATTTARTGGDGFHFVFQLPDDPAIVPNNRSKLRAGIDVRAENGQIVVAPTLHPTTHRAYAWEPGKAPWQLDPQVASARLMQMVADLQAPVVLALVDETAASIARHPSQYGVILSPADWVHYHWDFATFLNKHGWDCLGGERWRRPDKYDRGASAMLKGDGLGPLNVFTTEIPEELERLGKLDSTGQCISLTLFNFIAGYEHGGDTTALSRRVLADPAYIEHVGATPERAEPASPLVEATTLYPPPEFYLQRPWMAACQQMAHAVGGSPSAHLLAYLCRWATLIPPGYSIPPINGAASSFDLLCVIAGTSGSGKTSPMSNAEDMLPVIERADLRMSLGIGSGEGIIEAFYGMEEYERDDGKKVRERRKVVAGVNFSVSEGLIFADLANRGGTTHVTRLCDAWSGAALSTANASAETFRHIERGQYRLTLMMGIQADMAHMLMTDSAASQGFVGRLLFAWAEEPRVSPRPEQPGYLCLAVPSPISTPAMGGKPKRYHPTYLTYPNEVIAEIQVASDQRVGTNVAVEEHHHDLMRCKVAGILALMEGRIDVSMDDWAISTALVDCSAAVRNHLYAHRRQAKSDASHRAAVARAETEIVIEDVKDRQAIARMAEAIRRKVADNPMGQNKVTRAVSSGSTRHRFDRALDLAVANGWVRVVEDRIEHL
jgi:hypothetical protein